MWCPCNYTEITSLNCCLSSKVPSSNITESCSNYTFSEPFILNFLSICGGCTDLVVLNSSNPSSLDRTHHLTARWHSTNISMSGAEVICALASSGITQWARTATLTVLPASLLTPVHNCSWSEVRLLFFYFFSSVVFPLLLVQLP